MVVKSVIEFKTDYAYIVNNYNNKKKFSHSCFSINADL